MLHDELSLNKIKVLIGKRFFRFFKENLGTHLKTHLHKCNVGIALQRCSYKNSILETLAFLIYIVFRLSKPQICHLPLKQSVFWYLE